MLLWQHREVPLRLRCTFCQIASLLLAEPEVAPPPLWGIEKTLYYSDVPFNQTEHVTVAVIKETTILVPYLLVKSVHFIWRLGTCIFHLRMLDLQMSYKDFTTWKGTRLIALAVSAGKHAPLWKLCCNNARSILWCGFEYMLHFICHFLLFSVPERSWGIVTIQILLLALWVMTQSSYNLFSSTGNRVYSAVLL